MKTGFFHAAHPFTKILLVFFLMVTSYLIFLGIGFLLAVLFFHVPPREVIAVIENIDYEGHISLLKMMQVLYSSGFFLVPALLAAFLIGGRTGDYLRMTRIPGILVVLLMTILMFTTIPVINYVSVLNEKIALPARWDGLMERIIENDESQWNMMKAFLDTDRKGELLFNLFMIALVPSIGEEFLFRGVLQKIFSEWFRDHHVGIWVAALLFSLAHYQFFGFLPRLLLGALFGYLFVWTASIWVPVTVHLINNSMGVVYYYFYYRGTLSQDPDSLGLEKNVLLFLLFSTIISGMILAAIKKRGRGSADSLLL